MVQDISNICTEKLKQLLNEKRKELEELYNSEDYLWLIDNRDITSIYNSNLIKYKYYFYKKKTLEIYIEDLYNEISKIEDELELRKITIDKIVLQKRFDNRSNL